MLIRTSSCLLLIIYTGTVFNNVFIWEECYLVNLMFIFFTCANQIRLKDSDCVWWIDKSVSMVATIPYYRQACDWYDSSLHSSLIWQTTLDILSHSKLRLIFHRRQWHKDNQNVLKLRTTKKRRNTAQISRWVDVVWGKSSLWPLQYRAVSLIFT